MDKESHEAGWCNRMPHVGAYHVANQLRTQSNTRLYRYRQLEQLRCKEGKRFMPFVRQIMLDQLKRHKK